MKSNRQASALLIVLFTIAVTATLIGAALSWSAGSALVSQRASQLALGYSALDGMQEMMFSRWRDILKLNPALDYSADDLAIDGVSIPIYGQTASQLVRVTDPLAASVQPVYKTLGITFDAPTLKHVTQFGSPQPDNFVPKPGADSSQDKFYKGSTPGFPGYISFNIVYEASATGSIASRGGPVRFGVRRYLTKVITPVYQNAVFFQNDLELHNSGTTIIDGRVHTNSDLYACSFQTATDAGLLSFLGNVSYVGNYNGPNGDQFLSDAALDRFGTGPTGAKIPPPTSPASWDGAGQAQQLKQVDSLNVGGIDPTKFDTSDANHNNDSLRELIEIPYKKDPTKPLDDSVNTSDATQLDPPDIASQRAYNQAPLRILIDNGTLTVRDSQDHLVTNPTFLADINAAIPLAMRDRPLLDRREDPNQTAAAAVSVSTLDLDKFNKAISNGVASGAIKYHDVNNPGDGGWNGMLYIADISGNSGVGQAALGPAKKRGIMLTNGGILPGAQLAANDPNRSFTVATQNGLYIKGDYNTGSYTDPTTKTYMNQPPSNFDNSTPGVATEAPGYTSVPSSVMADAVTVVSRAFADADNSDPTNPIAEGNLDQPIQYEAGNNVRKAVATTINTAVVSGDMPSNYASNGKPSGGAHNLTRFLENWDDPTTPGGTDKVRFTYNGSLVQLFVSQEFTGTWDTKNIYQNPRRLIRFDPRFLQNPPVGRPNTIKYWRGKWTRF